MNISLRKLALGVGVLGLMAMPMAVRADGLNVDINLDNQAHFDFKGGARHHNRMIWKAAQQLQAAKMTLWRAPDNFNGHKADAIGAINAALDQLRICESK